MSDFTLEDLFNYRRKGAGNLVDAYEQLQQRNAELERKLQIEKELHHATEAGLNQVSEHLRETLNERDALAAYVERLRDTWQSSGGCSSHNCCIKAPHGMATNSGCRCYDNRSKMMMLTQRMNAVLQQSPKTALSERYAEVIENFIDNELRSACLASGWDTESSAYQVSIMLEQYANQLRSGEAHHE